MKWINKEIPIYPCKESDAGIGFYYRFGYAMIQSWYDNNTKVRWVRDPIYKDKFKIGLYFGKYLFEFDFIKGFQFCNYFATGGGV